MSCFARACKSNVDGKCIKTKEEFMNTLCPMLWFLTGNTKTLQEVLKEG